MLKRGRFQNLNSRAWVQGCLLAHSRNLPSRTFQIEFKAAKRICACQSPCTRVTYCLSEKVQRRSRLPTEQTWDLRPFLSLAPELEGCKVLGSISLTLHGVHLPLAAVLSCQEFDIFCEAMRATSKAHQQKSCWCKLPRDIFERLIKCLPDDDRCVGRLHKQIASRIHIYVTQASRLMRPCYSEQVLPESWMSGCPGSGTLQDMRWGSVTPTSLPSNLCLYNSFIFPTMKAHKLHL